MKTTSTITILLLMVAAKTVAQNTGIGTPLPKAALHIAKGDSGLLMLENTNSNNTGVRAGIFLRNAGNFTGAIQTIGTSAHDARLGFFTYTQASPGELKERLSILDDGKIGVNTPQPTTALDVNGTLRIRGGSPGLGKILTSDANGVASWQSSPFIAFRTAGLLDNEPLLLVQAGWIKVIYNKYVQYNYGQGYQPLSGNFVAPLKGIYHFDIRTDLQEQQWEIHMRLIQKRGNSTWEAAYIRNVGVAGGNGVSQLHNLVISTDLLVESGDTFWVEVYSSGAPTIHLAPAARGNWFGAHLVKDL